MPRRPLPDSKKREEQRSLRATTWLTAGVLLALAVIVLLYLLL